MGATTGNKSATGGREHATVKDVARRAGVSAATVSRVLSGDYPVSAATRNRVQRAIRELDYVANAQARALKGSGTRTVAFVLEDVTAPSFAMVAKGVEQQAAMEGRLCLLCTTNGDPDREVAIVEAMREQHAEAIILVGGGAQDDQYRQRMTAIARALQKAGSRLVLAGRPPLGDGVPATVVEYDNEAGAHDMVSYLLSRGHREIVFLGARDGYPVIEGRMAGFIRAHDTFGVSPGPIVPGGFTRESGYEQTRRLIALGTRFSAIFAATDMVACGALQALREARLGVPGDVSVVGYDDIPFATDMLPALTTVHVPLEEIGRTAVRLALHPEEKQHLVLGTHVVIRDSVATRLAY